MCIRDSGVTFDNLRISDRVHVVMPWHLTEDQILNNVAVGGENIGTTLRGIGPCYRDKVGRHNSVRLGDMYRDDFREKVGTIVAAKNRLLSSLGGSAIELDADAICEEFTGFAKQLEPSASAGLFRKT